MSVTVIRHGLLLLALTSKKPPKDPEDDSSSGPTSQHSAGSLGPASTQAPSPPPEPAAKDDSWDPYMPGFSFVCLNSKAWTSNGK
ncbi:hypothetical protein JTE90_007500 [Oedothorax gibbosus]|uniref:Uncharacterized protein n=1 Tax=Oedothorax gibbosus TaxID=931172 RepID=A0AAV6VLZ8_9ARAC|nr:hypothetical protein JTE90_007500 [Oedothorax gibbosus]